MKTQFPEMLDSVLASRLKDCEDSKIKHKRALRQSYPHFKPRFSENLRNSGVFCCAV